MENTTENSEEGIPQLSQEPNEIAEEESTQPAKKVKLFSAKEFRKQLQGEDKQPALQKFLQLCDDNTLDCIFEYLERGGSCLELLQLLETRTPHALVLEIVHRILLQVASSYPQLHSATSEACRYFLNTHVAVMNKMVGLSATSRERRIILKLLAVIVTFARTMAKDILMHINLNNAVIEVLTKNTNEAESVRSAFIHFLMAFLVDGDYATLTVLLEKRGLLMSIVNGLQYDAVEVVCMVMTIMKSNILENAAVTKTDKMRVFNTQVVREIVKLYNWKGPRGFNPKQKSQTVAVDEHDKAQVNGAVHSFLLVLCTSRRYGIIFRDHRLGLGQSHNSLMYTVLESLERPWEHSYAGELVTRICGACPDLVKNMWATLKTFLEPRATTRWITAMKFAQNLVKEVRPKAIEFCVRELSVSELAQVIQFLVAPTPILRTLITEKQTFESPVIKHHVILVLIEFLRAIQTYLSAAESWLKKEEYRVLCNILSGHIGRNFLTAQNVLRDWAKADEGLSVVNSLNFCFELLDFYESLAPQLIESLSTVDLKMLLEEIRNLDDDTTSLEIRTIKLFLTFEPSKFAPKEPLFLTTFPLVLEFYFKLKSETARDTLKLLLKNSGIFEGCESEMDIWIDAVLNLNSLDSVGEALVEVISKTSKDIFEYLSKMSKYSVQLEVENFQDILESLEEGVLDSSTKIKHKSLSPLLLASLESLSTNKKLKNYLNCVVVDLFHSQTSPALIAAVICGEKSHLSKDVVNYVKAWGVDHNPVILKHKTLIKVQEFSETFLEGDISVGNTCYFDQAVFYFCNLSKEHFSEIHYNNLKKVIGFAKEKGLNLKGIFQHPLVLQKFNPIHAGKSLHTDFITFAVKELQAEELEDYLNPFRIKIIAAAKKILKKGKLKSGSLVEVLEVFGMEEEHCLDVLNHCSCVQWSELESDLLAFYYSVVVFSSKTFLNSMKPLNELLVGFIDAFLTSLNNNQQNTAALAEVFKNYLENSPGDIKIIQSGLFESILTKSEFCKDSALLAGFLLNKRSDFLGVFSEHLGNIQGKKGLMLALISAAIAIRAPDDVLKNAYQNFEPSILKALQKPQKAGLYFEMYREVLPCLITKYTPEKICKSYVEKTLKFDVTEPFHIQMLITVFKKVLETDPLENYLSNAILTLIHASNSLFKKKKSDEELTKLLDIFREIGDFLIQLKPHSLKSLPQNESFQLFCKFCLKFGIPSGAPLLKVFKLLLNTVDFEEDNVRLLLDMAGSHSEFLDVALGEDCDCKVELMDTILTMCQRWPGLMQKNHLSVLFAGYRATVRLSDRIILMLLQMYEKAADRTFFYDFKPFLWSTAAAAHYSVRQNVQTSLWRQPKMGDVLDILQEEWVLKTITSYPLDSGLVASKTFQSENIYDLAFLLPLFASLLAPENQVSITYFTNSGALSLTIVALSSNNRELRLAACHVLARFHGHLEAKQGGRSKTLWLRFVEAVCRGTALVEENKLNSFAAMFWARMGIILSKPLQPLYVPLANYLAAKSAPDLKRIPELYTFLHNPDTSLKETRTFILEILRDGMRTDKDFMIALHSMAIKLIMELFSSSASDIKTKVLILKVIQRACALSLGRQKLCGSCGLLSWLDGAVECSCEEKNKVLSSVIDILKCLIENVDTLKADCKVLHLIVEHVNDSNLSNMWKKSEVKT